MLRVQDILLPLFNTSAEAAKMKRFLVCHNQSGVYQLTSAHLPRRSRGVAIRQLGGGVEAECGGILEVTGVRQNVPGRRRDAHVSARGACDLNRDAIFDS